MTVEAGEIIRYHWLQPRGGSTLTYGAVAQWLKTPSALAAWSLNFELTPYGAFRLNLNLHMAEASGVKNV